MNLERVIGNLPRFYLLLQLAVGLLLSGAAPLTAADVPESKLPAKIDQAYHAYLSGVYKAFRTEALRFVAQLKRDAIALKKDADASAAISALQDKITDAKQLPEFAALAVGQSASASGGAATSDPKAAPAENPEKTDSPAKTDDEPAIKLPAKVEQEYRAHLAALVKIYQTETAKFDALLKREAAAAKDPDAAAAIAELQGKIKDNKQIPELLALITSQNQATSTAPLGSARFYPSLERPIGWRGDGTGQYPAATPPTKWSRTINNGSPASSGILWMTPVPRGSSAPIVVGDRIFFGFDPYGLMCVSKKDGRILWYRTHHYYEVMPEAERKKVDGSAQVAYAKMKDHLDSELNRMSQAVSPVGVPESQRFMKWEWGQKLRDMEKELDSAVKDLDREKYSNAKQEWEWASATPVSDGKYVYMWYSHRVAVCYDLDGNRQWATIEPSAEVKGTSEHGRHSSPVLAANKFIVQYGRDIIAFDRKTGKVAWTTPMTTTPAWCTPAYSSIVLAYAARQPYVVTCMGEAFRAFDGERGWLPHKDYAGENTSSIVERNSVFVWDRNGLFQLQIPPAPGPSVQAAVVNSDLWKGYLVGSPLCVNGLIYTIGTKGELRVFDAVAGSELYTKDLPLTIHYEYVFFPGYAASPTLAGKYIYILDNQGGTLILEPGRTYKQVAINKIDTPEKSDKGSVVFEQTITSPVFDGKLMFVRGQQYLYCIGSR